MKFNALLASVSLPILAVAAISPAFAQSTGTDTVEETITVTGRANKSTGGLIKPETVTKTRSTVDQTYIKTQAAGQSVIQSLNLLPGVNFTNSDPYGSSGGNIRLRGFDGARISLTADGMPLNDTGNYATYTNQLFDPEIIGRTTVNLGTTDVDSPTASATGGTINIVTRRPDETPTARMTASFGSFDYKRIFASVDTGRLFEGGPTAFIGGSYQKYDKFKGPGDLEKIQVNGKIFQELSGDDFISLAFHYNENRNAFYRNLTKAQIDYYGHDYDNLDTCARAPVIGGEAGNDGGTPFGAGDFMNANDNPLNPGSCTNFYGLRINPSNTGNIRGQSSFALTDSIRLTVDPSFQYTLADGGGTTVISESDSRLIGLSGVTGVDLNGDGDDLDQVRLYTPNVTNTYRYGLSASLIWDLDENNTIRAAYTLDYGRHRQTGEYGFLKGNNKPVDVFGGRNGDNVDTADGSILRGRDRKSVAKLNQFALSYDGRFLDDALKVSLGVRIPYFERELNQYCYSADGTSNVRCTTETPSEVLANGNVLFASTGTTQYIRPYEAEKKYDDVLPNVGVSYEFAENNIIYASYAEGLSAPRTDNLYTPKRNAVTGEIDLTDVDPEKTSAYDIGYRFQGEELTISAAYWLINYDNRIVNSFDDLLGIFIDRNVGKVDLQGVDIEAGWTPVEGLSLYASGSYIDSELQENIPLSATSFLPTAGKQLVETPEWQAAGRIQYEVSGFTFGFQGKYVGKRYSTDVNDETSPSYTVFDADIRYDFAEMGYPGTYVQFNAINLFDKDYLANISSTTNAATLTPIGSTSTRSGSLPTYSIGAPQTFQVSVGLMF